MNISYVYISESTDKNFPNAVKCLVSPKQSNRRPPIKRKIEISGTGEVGVQIFFTLAIMCSVDESHRGEPRNGQLGGRA
jgi:hypothetical protein